MKDGLTNSTPWNKKQSIRYRLLPALILLLGAHNLAAETRNWGIQNAPFELYTSEGIQIHSLAGGDQYIQLERLHYPLTYSQELESVHISFDESSPVIRAGQVLKADYKTIELEDSINQAASFEQPIHQYWFAPSDFMFLNNSENTGDFSIYFRMKPYQLKRKMEIMQKAGLFGGIKQGISCGWDAGQLYFEFSNFFWGPSGPLESLRLASRDSFQTDRFFSVLLTYTHNDGALTLYVNGVEQNKYFATSDMTPQGDIYTPRFHRWDKSPLIIGKNYLGAIDDVVLSNFALDPAAISGKYEPVKRQGNRFIQKSGVAISRIIELPTSKTEIHQIGFEERELYGTNIRYYYRYSDKPFDESLSEYDLPYRRLEEGGSLLIHAKYLQWKAELYSDAMGEQSPRLESMRLLYTPDEAPQAPIKLDVVEVGREKVTLQFMRSLEMDVVMGGRYHIYYGLKPYEPLGVIKYKDFYQEEGKLTGVPISDLDHWVTDDLRYQNRILVTIDNAMISANLSYFKSYPRMLYEYPLLQKDIPYYFWVTACDRAWSEEMEHADHESQPSEYIVVRPH